MRSIARLAFLALLAGTAACQEEVAPTPVVTPEQAAAAQQLYLKLMRGAWQRASAHGSTLHPVLSPTYASLFAGEVPVEQLHAEGFLVLPGTSSTPEVIHKVISSGSDGLITDRPDITASLVAAEAARAPTAQAREHLLAFDIQGHRGGRGLRPENTLPSFENGLDLGITTIETDTAVTRDGVSTIWHDQYVNPRSCRRTGAKPLQPKEKVYWHDLTLKQMQESFVCDGLYFGPEQRNDLSLSPVATAFAKRENLPSPYTPISLAQLFRFVHFYADYYEHGPGAKLPQAPARLREARRVRYNIETKLTPLPLAPGGTVHTAEPQAFVDGIWTAITSEHTQKESEIQSFDFRTLALFEQQHPELKTYYLTSTPEHLQAQLSALEK